MLHWKSESFPLVYAALVALLVFPCRFLRKREERRETPADVSRVPEIQDTFELAMLAGGTHRTAHTALVSLLLSGSLTVRTGLLKRSVLIADGPVPELPIARAVYEAVREPGKLRFREAMRGLPRRMTYPAMEQRLRQAGLLSRWWFGRFTWVVLPLVLLLIPGLASLSAALARKQDVAFTLFVNLWNLAYIFSFAGCRLTRLGRQTLNRARATHRTKGLEPLASFALFGPAILPTLPLPADTAEALGRWSAEPGWFAG